MQRTTILVVLLGLAGNTFAAQMDHAHAGHAHAGHADHATRAPIGVMGEHLHPKGDCMSPVG